MLNALRIVPLLLVLLVTGGSSGGESADDPKVVFRVWHDGGNSTKPNSGLVIAGWSDGLVIFALSPEKPGKELQVGNLSEEQLRAVLRELQEAGFFGEHKSRGWPPDAAYTRISAALDGKSATYEWTEHLSSPWEANVDADPKFKAFVRMWVLSRTAFSFAYPSKYKPLREVPDAERRFSRAVGRNEVSR